MFLFGCFVSPSFLSLQSCVASKTRQPLRNARTHVSRRERDGERGDRCVIAEDDEQDGVES
jgi:hypothetical protein